MRKLENIILITNIHAPFPLREKKKLINYQKVQNILTVLIYKIFAYFLCFYKQLKMLKTVKILKR